MLELLGLGLAAVVAICGLQLLANKSGLPAAALLTVAGLVYALLPGPNLTLHPEIILDLVIPPLIYSAALDSSLLAIRKNLRAVISLSIGLVLVTALLTGVGLSLAVPGLGLAAGVALGAAVSPTDPVAALAVGGRVGLPVRMITIIEGEGLLNDATALTTLTVAVTAATSGGFSLGDAVLRFVLAAAGGLVAGAVVAVAVRLTRPVVRDPVLVNCISLATPFAAYLLGEEAHVSGVLAVAVAGLMVGHDTPRFTSGASRLQVSAVWRLVDFLLQGFVFLLIGQQIVPVVRGLRAYPAGTVAAAVLVTVGVVLLLRPLWLVLSQRLLRRKQARRTALSGREIVVLSWAGTRGVISLAAIFTLPLTVAGGRSFPDRDLLLFCAYVIVVVTLVLQGVTFAPIVRALGVHADPADVASVRNDARAASVKAGLTRLDQLAEDPDVPEHELEGLRSTLQIRRRRYQGTTAGEDDGDGLEVSAPGSPEHEAVRWARRAVIDAQREELLRWRDAGLLPDSSLRVLERELDHEERTFPAQEGPDGRR
ncbi:MAG TPA: Na+/H+ antiporter [Streptosporangiaceae bacterium]|jgi:CPA1 family monovalent cation:H+ antiporter|nr:Na+/H+ antiporter [Streptosporangiaceae bacterium]